MAEQNTGFLCNKFTRFALSTVSQSKNRELTALSSYDFLTYPNMFRDLAWLGHGIHRAPAYELKKEVIEAVDKLAFNQSLGREWLTEILGHRPEFYTPPAPIMWIEWTNLRSPNVKEGFLLEHLQSGERGVRATYFSDSSQSGLVPSVNSHICSYELSATPEHDQRMVVYRQFQPLQFSDRDSLEVRQQTTKQFVGHTHFLNTILIFLNSHTPILKLTEPNDGGKQKDATAKISQGKSPYIRPGAITLDLSHVPETGKAMDEDEAKRLIVEQIVSGRWPIVNDALTTPRTAVAAVKPSGSHLPATNPARNVRDISLADFVIESGQHAQKQLGQSVRAIGRELVINRKRRSRNVTRLILDQEAKDIWAKIDKIPFEYFIGLFNRDNISFDKLWIEETIDPKVKNQPGNTQRRGFLLEKGLTEVRARYATELVLADSAEVPRSQAYGLARQLGSHLRNDRYILADDIVFIMNEKGVSVDYGNSIYSKLGGSFPKDRFEATKANDLKYAECVFRLLILVSSKKVEINIDESLDATPAKLYPVHFNFSEDDVRKAMEVGDAEAIKNLLERTNETSSAHLEQGTEAIPPGQSQTPALQPTMAVSANLDDISLADFVTESVKNSTRHWAVPIRPIGRELISIPERGRRGAARFILDHNVQAILDLTKDISLENFSGQQASIRTPAEPMWLETTIFENERGKPEVRQRAGALIKRSIDNFNIYPVREIILHKSSSNGNDFSVQRIQQLGGYVRDNRVVLSDDVEVILSDCKLTAKGGERFRETYGSRLQAAPDRTSLEKDLFSGSLLYAEYFLRFLVLASSQNVETNIWDIQQDGNPERLLPVQMTISDELRVAFENGDVEAAQRLLGWANEAPVAQLEQGAETTAPHSLPATSATLADIPISDITLADSVVESGRLSTGYWREAVSTVGRELISNPRRGRYGAVRFVLDPESERQIQLLASVGIEDIPTVYRHYCMPFNSIWIETTVPEEERERSIQRVAYQIKKSEETISLRLVSERLIPDAAKRNVEARGAYVSNGRVIFADGIEVIFSEKQGITLTEASATRHFRAEYLRHDSSSGPFEETAYVGSRYISRFLLAISSRDVETNIWDVQLDQVQKNGAQSELLPLSVRVSDDILRALEAKDFETAKTLLGWADQAIGINGPTSIDGQTTDASSPSDNDASSGETLPPGAAWTEDGIQFPRTFESVVATGGGATDTQSVHQGPVSAPLVENFTEEEEKARERSRLDAFKDTKVRLLAEASMFLMQAQNRGFNCFDCRIVLHKPDFPILLHFSMEVDLDGENRIRTKEFILQKYAQAYADRLIPLTMSDAVDLKVIVQSMIYNAEGIVPFHRMSASSHHTVGLDTQMPLPMIGEPRVIQQSGGMYTLTYDAENPYDKEKIIRPFIPLGLAAVNLDEEERRELDERVQVVINYLREKANERSEDGYRIIINKRDVLDRLEAHITAQNKEWVTAEQKKLDKYEKASLFYVSSKGNQKITLGPVTLHMDVGGANPSWHCTIAFYIGDKTKRPMGEAVRTRVLNLHTRNFDLAQTRARETLLGAKSESGNQIFGGLLISLYDHMHATDDEWRVVRTKIRGKSYEDVLIGDQRLQTFFDDAHDYAYDIGVGLETSRVLDNGNVEITLQAMRSRIPNFEHPVAIMPEAVHEIVGNRRSPITFNLTIPAHGSHNIDKFVAAANQQVEDFAAEHYAPVALGTEGNQDRRKAVRRYQTARIALTVMRAVEELFDSHFQSRLPKNWHGRDGRRALKAVQNPSSSCTNPAVG